ncbi:MAG: hypothetical protein AAF288_05300 [Planctomycetota bacterium]
MTNPAPIDAVWELDQARQLRDTSAAEVELRLAEAARDPRALPLRALLALLAARRRDRVGCQSWLQDEPESDALSAVSSIADAAWGDYAKQAQPDVDGIVDAGRDLARVASDWAVVPALGQRVADDPHAAHSIACGLIEAGQRDPLLRMDAALEHALPLILGDRRLPVLQARVETAEALGWSRRAAERAESALGEFPRDERLALALHRLHADRPNAMALAALERVHRAHPRYPDVARCLEERRAIEAAS